jgi:hypothetical protein
VNSFSPAGRLGIPTELTRMPVITTINFQIIGLGGVELGGAAAAVGTLSGPYWNTIQIVDPSSATVEFSTGITQPAGWDFITWGGQIVPGVLGFGTLPIATDVSASYLAVAVFAEGPQTTPVLCLSQSCGIGLVTGAPPEPSHESVRIANKVRACACEQANQSALRESVTTTERVCLCPVRRPAQEFRTVHHRRESERILREVVRCTLFFQNRDTGALCPAQHTTVYAPQPSPYRLEAQRIFHRIHGIEEICRPVRNVSAAEHTARLRALTENSNATLRRHSEHFRTLPPPLPCRLVRTGPQPGVPIAPVTPCILANQRVDYSPPTK